MNSSKKPALSLNKEVLRDLTDEDLNQVAGGGTSTAQCASGYGMCIPRKGPYDRLTPTVLCTA